MTFSYFDYLIGNLILPVLCLAFISVPVFRLGRLPEGRSASCWATIE